MEDRPWPLESNTELLWGRKKEEREIRGVEQVKSIITYSDYTKRGSSHLTIRQYFILMITSLRSRHR
jgi:hypothetical protein